MANFKEKSASGISYVSADTLLLDERKVFLEGDISPEMAFDFMKKMMVLVKKDATSPIKVIINSCGGDINAGLLIYDVIQNCTCDVDLYCSGRALSMGALLLACGKKGHRFILEHSEVMLHEPLLGGGVSGSCSSLLSISERLMQTKKVILDLLVKHTKNNYETLEKAIAYDHYFSAQEAIDFDLCDEIVSFKELL